MPLCYLFSTRGPNARATYIVHLSTMCHIFDGSARPAIFVCWLARKTQTWYTPVGRWDLAFCQVSLNLVQQFQRRSPKYLRKSEAGRLSCFFPIGQKKKKTQKQKQKHKLGTGRWDVASCQVSFNLVQRFQRRSRQCPIHQRPGRPSCYSHRPEKHNLGRVRWEFSSCQVSLNSVQRFQMSSRKCLAANQRPGGHHAFFRSAQIHKLRAWYRTLRSCFLSTSVEFRLVFSDEKSKMSQPIRGRVVFLFFRSAQKHKLGTGRWDLASGQLKSNSV